MVEAGANEITEAEILDALDIAHDEIKKLCAAQRDLRRAGRQGRRSRSSAPKVDEGLLEQIKASHGDALDAGHAGRGQARAPGRHQGGRGGGPRDSTPATRPTTSTERRAAVQRAFDKLEKDDHPPPDRRRQEAPRRPRRRRDPRDLDRGGHRPAHARLGDLHPRPDAGLHGRHARHEPRGAAPRHARARDAEALLPPLQLPAVLGRGGRASCAAPSAATSATARSPSGRCCR